MSSYQSKNGTDILHLTASQLALKQLSVEILAKRPPEVTISYWNFSSRQSPADIQEKLRVSTIGDLLLRDGESLSAIEPLGYYPDLGLYVGRAAIVDVEVWAWGWEEPKRRIDPRGSQTPPYDVIEYPGQTDWTRQLDISLKYANPHTSAQQTITAYTSSRLAGSVPLLSRDVAASAYDEQGYEGHNQVSRSVTDSEVLFFVSVARELFEARVER